jgi:uncharacterized protein (DUF1501 family)
MNRKEFIRLSSLISASTLVPEFIKASARQLGNNPKRPLVIVQLSGGNDGLNTIIPYRNDIYFNLRPNISIELPDALKLTDEFGIHSKLHGFKELYDAGYLSVINNVGYPNPNRSHFRSMDIWQSASDASKYVNTGWVGRWLDTSCKNECNPYYAIETDDALSLALKGELQKGLAFNHPAQFYSSASNPIIQAIAREEAKNSSMSNQLAYLQKTLAEATSSAQYIHSKLKIREGKSEYPDTILGHKLKLVADLILSDCHTSVYYVSISGFDTHASQNTFHGRLLAQVNDAVLAFVNDMVEAKLFNDTMLMLFSEFGRRVKQNGSRGTDHGAANQVMLVSGTLKKQGFYNDGPDLKNLDENGDIRFTVDFREVYATLIDKWLGGDSNKILQKQFTQMQFI